MSAYNASSADAAMEVMRACRCCLWCPADRDLTTPYTHLGKTEIYLDMFKECFDLELAVGGDGSCGICSACAGRLRDARDFKLQVQRCQAELRARQTVDAPVKEEESAVEPDMEDGAGNSGEPVSGDEPRVKLEMLDEDETVGMLGSVMADGDRTSDADEPVTHEEPRVEPEMADEDETDDEVSHSERAVKAEQSDAASSDEDCMSLALDALARAQLATSCSVRLERLRGDEAPHASHTSLATLHESRRASRVKETHDNTAGRSAEEAYICDTCGKRFIGKPRLIAHVRIHLAQDESARTYSIIRHIGTHIKLPKNSHGKLFERNITEKPFPCKDCNKQFTHISTLRNHERFHTGEKLYTCVCNKRFSIKRNFIEHIRIHTGEKPYTCKECNKRFAHKSTLVSHERIHTPYKTIYTGVKPHRCKECNKQFRRKCTLDDHKITHTGEKPYSCEECNRQFSRITNLYRHMRIHKGEKLYSCDQCNIRFAHKKTLACHKRIHR